jgi:GNAT superfamily N-acetyltransferase
MSPARRVMPAEGRIRQFQSEDAEECCSLVRACLSLDPLIPLAVKEDLLRAESPAMMRNRAGLFYVAVFMLGSRVAGVGGLDLNEIRLLFVNPEHQHQGIGGSFLGHLEALVPPALFGDIFVYSTPDAAGFYHSHGYRSRGQHPFYVGEYVVPTIFMTKRLG